MSQPTFSHLDSVGHARMVDVGDKSESYRTARAEAIVRLGPAIARDLANTGGVNKGNVMETARIAGIMAAKRTAEIIPMCHPLRLDHLQLEMTLFDERLRIIAEASCHGRTGVEMEAMTAAAVAALTVYDMCKSASKGIVIEQVRLLEKTGGKSGCWRENDGSCKE